MISTQRLKSLDLQSRDKLRAKSVLLGRPLIGPQSINIHIIQACDRKCAFCWYFSPYIKNPPKREVLNYEVLARTLEDCQEIGVDEINLEGGEVVLYPRCEELFHKVKDLGMRLRAYSHLDFESKHLKYLALADLLTVNLSAMTEDIYGRVHGKQKGSLHNLLKHLDLLLSLRRKYGKPKITLSFVLYNENYKQLRSFLELAKDREIDEVIVRFFKATQEMQKLMLNKEQIEELREVVDDVRQKPYAFKHNLESLWGIITNSGIFEETVAIDHGKMHNDRLFYYDATKGLKSKCYIGWYYSHIDEFGRVLAPCDSVGVCIAGNIHERRFKDIWFDNDFMHETLREAAEGIQTCKEKWKECRHCSYVSTNKYLDGKVMMAHGSEKVKTSLGCSSNKLLKE